MHEDHIVVENKAIENGKSKNDEDCEIDAYQAIALLSHVVVIESEVVSMLEVLVNLINKNLFLPSKPSQWSEW